ncbi:MAG TPA: MBL fold metallo-hydrolase [Patescibacteria group bacterium]|nr:MBL fold metallo-hydrolase [Patescibacteria group bacterium]
MNISWYGQSCFKIEAKIKKDKLTVITDPYNKSIGFRLPKVKADIVTVSHDHDDHNNSEAVNPGGSGKKIIVNRPGEYEVSGCLLQGVGAFHDKEQGDKRGKVTMFNMDINGINVLHMGDIGTKLSDKQLEVLGNVDILLIPVGGVYTVDAKEAAEIVRQLEPRIVIPMHYKVPGLKLDLDGLDKFKKEMGNSAEILNKLKVKKKDLPQDRTELVILEKV